MAFRLEWRAMRLLFLFGILCLNQTSSYRFTLEDNETGRFFYEDGGGNHGYCTSCPTGMNDEENRKTQNGDCITQNFFETMPNNGPKPFCKENATGGIIPGCGFLPTEGGLTWLENGSEAGSYSLPGNFYIPKCPLGQSASAAFHCGENNKWKEDPSSAVCVATELRTAEYGQCSDSCIIGICSGLFVLVLLGLAVGVRFYCTRRKKLPDPSASLEMNVYSSPADRPNSGRDFSPMPRVATETAS
ncbi:uncharacterized protein LOC134242453 isoform X3 [Saccostrea cucullata]|uniref:uncharacterized protein LOC134242453 isoform X3 n=1 Tax=Saccostrea cuccullata TaxID=36930 RepID=UPI002ED06781